MNVFLKIEYADVMELVDVPDSKSGVGNYVPVRPRPSAFLFYTRLYYENTKYTELSKFANLLCEKDGLMSTRCRKCSSIKDSFGFWLECVWSLVRLWVRSGFSVQKMSVF